MNLRVILLKKTAILHKDAYTSDLKIGKEMLGPWVTMGHFDSMYSYQLDIQNRNVFSVIHENNKTVAKKNNGNGYFHPLYLLTDTSDEAFWKQNSWFIAVTRIHLASTVINPHDIKKLKEDISNQCKKTGCHCHLYQTIELSDLILVVKSNRISPMLDTVLNLWTCSGIGKVYSYCGIDYGYLTKPEAQPMRQNPVGFLSIRFAVRDFAKANGFFRFIEDTLGGKPIYSIAGVDDVIMNFQNLQVPKLVRFFRNWFVEGLPEKIDLVGAFSDITTRLGAPLQYWGSLPSDGGATAPAKEAEIALQDQCQKLVDLNVCVWKLADNKPISQIDRYWLRNLLELTYSLLRLSRSALMDEFVYLMLPGIRAFLYNLKDILSENDPNCLSVLDKEGCCWFVDQCTHLIEHVMRTEGQLAHHPETRPILYDIPLAMLEHILAFLDLCTTILQNRDQPQKQIHFILLPSLCSELKTTELFSASSQHPGLLAISIPLHLMYEPQTVQIALCHEISHFVGERHRERKLRKDCYISAVATLIADVIFETERESFAEQIRQRLDNYISSNADENTWTISKYMEAVQTWVNDFLYSADFVGEYGRLIRDTLDSESSICSGAPLLLHASFDDLRMRNTNFFVRILKIFTTLFREVFADICMVRLLDLNADTYMDAFRQDISENPDAAEFYAVRIFTTLAAVNQDVPERCSAGGEAADRFFRALARLAQSGDREPGPGVYQFPAGCVKQLEEYSKCCATDLIELLNNDAVEKLRRMYENVSGPSMNYQVLQQYIQAYRGKYLGVDLPKQSNYSKPSAD